MENPTGMKKDMENALQQITGSIRSMISVSDQEMNALLDRCMVRSFLKKEIVAKAGQIPNEVFFIHSGLIRVLVGDREGVEHTVHFALENQFIADYSCFLLRQPAYYSLQALEDTRVVMLPRIAIEWGYANLEEGDKLGRKIAEFYFIYQDARIKNQFTRSPKERYDALSSVFPDIHNRVPQHMIASYLGISPVHLSRLKKASFMKA